MIRRKIKAFTLAEVMITLAVMGVLASIMLPVMSKIRPDKTKATFKKAYYVVERTVFDMVTDESLYPELGSYKGFDNTQEVTYNGNKYSGNTKFLQLFAAHVNKISPNKPSGTSIPSDGSNGSPNIITSDGIAYYIPASDFQGLIGEEKRANALKIMIDVNGATVKPNTVGVDRFYIYIQADGRMFVRPTGETPTKAENKAASYIGSMNITQDQPKSGY